MLSTVPSIGLDLPSTNPRLDLQQKAQQLLNHSNYLPLRNLRCDVEGEVVVVYGVVPSYYLKQVAQTLLASLEVGATIENRVEVRSHAK